MENEMVVTTEVHHDLSMARAPQQVLVEAQNAAKALQEVISKSKTVKFNGKTYLSFEHWQTCGRFYGVTAKIVSTEPVDLDGTKGFIARAEAITHDGRVISAAEAMCMNDEPNWAKKPLFQLRSMAQTRACAKALRNVLAWVVVLAGYEPTAAEEMTGEETAPHTEIPAPQRKSAIPTTTTTESDATDEGLTFETFTPAAVSIKTAPDGKWTKYGIKTPGNEWIGTFDKTAGELAQKAKADKSHIKVGWVVENGYKTAKSVEAA